MRLRGWFRDRVFLQASELEAGRGTLFYIHGLGESGRCFEHLASQSLLADWNQVIPDLPGYGRSCWPPKARSLHQTAGELAALASDLAPGPRVVLGHSMGGVLGQLICEAFPGTFDAFVNIEGNLSLDDCTYSGRTSGLTEERFLADGWPRLLDEIYEQGLQGRAIRGYFASLMFCDPRSFFRHGRELLELSREEQLASRLAKLPMPHLFVGGLDGGIGPRSRELLGRAGVNWVGLSESGHWPFIDRVQEFLDAVAPFLQGVVRS